MRSSINRQLRRWHRWTLGAVIASTIAVSGPVPHAQQPTSRSDAYITGTVESSNGKEAGVWVIAQTTDLPTPLIKIVVTDDQGRFTLPELPGASYNVWVRGYGLADSTPVTVV